MADSITLRQADDAALQRHLSEWSDDGAALALTLHNHRKAIAFCLRPWRRKHRLFNQPSTQITVKGPRHG